MNVNYNRLNLPDSVIFPLQGNTMKLEYLADGRRVRTTAKTYGTPLVLPGGGSTPQNPVNILEEVRDGELVFRDGQLVELRTDGGYFSLYNDSLSTTQVRPYFYVTDYLGSVRMVCDGITGEVRQSLEYLPSGYVFRSTSYAFQPMRFCGKELMTIHGWDVYDSQARLQYSLLPRFSTMDPLAEKYYSLSPYNYAGNDFVNAVDSDGNEIVMRTIGSNGEYQNYSFHLEKFGFYDVNGNILDNDASKKVLLAFGELMKGSRGSQLVSNLSSREESVLIEVAAGNMNNAELDGTSEGFNSAIRWSPTKETPDGLPAFISLAHEMAHSEDRLNGTLDSST